MNAIRFARSAVAVAALLVAGLAAAHDSSGSVSGSNALTSASTASATANGNVGSTAQAANIGFARTEVFSNGSAGQNTTTSYAPTTGNNLFGTGVQTTVVTRQGEVHQGGVSETFNSSYAATTGQGANALAQGTAQSNTAGSGEFHTQGTGPKGSVSGNSGATTNSFAGSSGTGTSLHEGGVVSSWTGNAAADIKTTTVQNCGKVLGVFVAGNTSSQGDVKNVSTSATGGATVNPTFNNVNTGLGFGGLTNTGFGSGAANASVSATVSASH